MRFRLHAQELVKNNTNPLYLKIKEKMKRSDLLGSTKRRGGDL